MRNKDGTLCDGNICYPSSSYDSLLRFSLEDARFPTLEKAQEAYAVHGALDIPMDKKSLWGKFDPLYIFVYGQPITVFEGNFSLFDANQPQKKKWQNEDVANMDWGMFCLFFWTFLCTKDGIHSFAWHTLRSMLTILQQEPQLLLAHFAHLGYSEADIPNFWASVYEILSKRLSMHMDEKNCGFAHSDLAGLKDFLPTERYLVLEAEYCVLFDKIARSRINAAIARNYSAEELIHFDIEKLFFYKDFFALSSASSETKKYVYNKTFDFLHKMGNRFLSLNQEINAYSIYQNALNYAQSSSERVLIIQAQEKINPKLIAAYNASIASAQAKRQREKSKNAFSSFLVPLFGVFILLSVPATIIFGIWSLIRVSRFSIIALSVSACFAILGIIVLIYGKSRENTH